MRYVIYTLKVKVFCIPHLYVTLNAILSLICKGCLGESVPCSHWSLLIVTTFHSVCYYITAYIVIMVSRYGGKGVMASEVPTCECVLYAVSIHTLVF